MSAISKEEATAAVTAAARTTEADPDTSGGGRTVVHTFRGFMGCDWDLSDAVAMIEAAAELDWDEDGIRAALGHNLLVKDPACRGTVAFEARR